MAYDVLIHEQHRLNEWFYCDKNWVWL